MDISSGPGDHQRPERGPYSCPTAQITIPRYPGPLMRPGPSGASRISSLTTYPNLQSGFCQLISRRNFRRYSSAAIA